MTVLRQILAFPFFVLSVVGLGFYFPIRFGLRDSLDASKLFIKVLEEGLEDLKKELTQ